MSGKQIDQSEVARWRAVASDGTTSIVERLGRPMVMITWDDEHSSWECSEHGLFATKSLVTCMHIQAACRDMAPEVATWLATALSRPRTGKTAPEKATEGPNEEAIAQARAAITRAEAKALARRNAARDAEHQRLTSQVTTRQISDADRDRLAERREAKRRTLSW